MIAHAASPLRIVLLGPPASGKGTQGARLASHFGLGYLSTGALLRAEMETESALGKLARPILARGGYLPDDLMSPLIASWLACQPGGWVLDGFPRSIGQAEFLDEWLAENGSSLDAVISFEAPFPELLQRVRQRVECPECRWSGKRDPLSGSADCPECDVPAAPRADDTEANFRNRYEEFVSSVLPVISYYRDRNRLRTCDGSPPPELVASHLLQLFQECPA